MNTITGGRTNSRATVIRREVNCKGVGGNDEGKRKNRPDSIEPEARARISAIRIHRWWACRANNLYGMRMHDAATYFVSYSYNFCWPVRTLRVEDDKGWQARTPAVAAGLADHVWSLREWLTYPAKPCLPVWATTGFSRFSALGWGRGVFGPPDRNFETTVTLPARLSQFFFSPAFSARTRISRTAPLVL